MADDNELTLKDPAAAKKKKLIMIVALVVLLLGGGGAGAWFMFAGSDAPAAEEAEAAKLGGNAVIGVDLDYEVLGQNGSMLMVSASGTAVVV